MPRSCSTVAGAFALLLPTIAAAQEQPVPLEQFLQQLGGRYPIGSLFRFDPPPAVSKEPILNQPEALGLQIERRIDRLPQRGRAAVVPWSGWWWPMRQDGIAAGGQQSPIARYARAFALGEAPLQWERQHHGTAGSRRPDAWWGHCNGWAAAAVLEPLPLRDAARGGVTLTPTDLSALLASAYFGCHALGVDERYVGAEVPEVDALGRPTDRTYRDANPAVLHLLATNRIGVDGKAFVADLSPGAQVWNHPVWAFEIAVQRELADAAAAMAELTARTHTGPYPYNPEATRFFAVTARFQVALALTAPGAPASADGAGRHNWVEYSYVLETDSDGRILGGEWAREWRRNHPDFCWVPLTPSSSYTLTPDGGVLVGTTGIGNPHVVYEDLVPLVRHSAGLPPLPTVAPAVAAAAASATGPAAHPGLDPGAGRWNRPGDTADPRWTRVLQLAQSQVQQAALPAAIATLTPPLQSASSDADPASPPLAVRHELLLQRGWLHFIAQRPQLALADYADLPNDGPLGPSVRARRALFLIARGDGIRALSEAAQAIHQNPDNPWGYCARAWVLLSRRGEHDLERAAADLERAVQLGAEPFVLCSGLQLQRSRPAAAQSPDGGPQVPLPTAIDARLDALPAAWRQLFSRRLAGIQIQQESK